MGYRTQHVVAALAVLVLLGSAAVRAVEAEKEGDRSPAIEGAREIGQEAAQAVPGLSVAVGANGEVVWAEGFGWADLEARAGATAGTRYAVYSAAKAWTAAAGLCLVGEGLLGIQEPIGTYLPGLPEPLSGATPYHLANHSAGVRHYQEGEADPAGRHCDSLAESLAIFRDDPLLFAPGTDRAYSSWGYVLLSAVIEAAAGQPFVEVLDGRVFTSAAMEDTRFADPAVEIPGRAVPYRRSSDGDWERVAGLDVTCKWGAGGFLSTAPDLVRFYLALLRGDLLDERAAAMLIRPEEDGSFRFGGFSHGGRSVIVGNLQSGVVVALATNAQADGADLGGAAERILEGFEAAVERPSGKAPSEGE